MKLAAVRKIALALPEATEAPHHHFTSFRVSGKIFVTATPEDQHVHLFVSEQDREAALALYPDFVEKLFWGGKVVGVRVTLASASRSAVKSLVQQAWRNKAPKALQHASNK
jgi:hypothetical protein